MIDRTLGGTYRLSILIGGGGFADVYRGHDLSGTTVAIGFVRQVLQDLEAAHARGIVHRDIKPQNVRVTPMGLVKIMDFGIAKDAAATTLTRTTHYLGTPAHMAPEQARGGPVDGRTDLYAAALLLFELLTGRPAFDAPSPWETLRLQQTAPPPGLAQFRPDVPAALERIVACALEKTPDRRCPTARAMLAALDALANESSSPPTWRVPGPTEIRRGGPAGLARHGAAASLSVVALAAIAGLIGLVAGVPRPPTPGPTGTPATPILAAAPAAPTPVPTVTPAPPGASPTWPAGPTGAPAAPPTTSSIQPTSTPIATAAVPTATPTVSVSMPVWRVLAGGKMRLDDFNRPAGVAVDARGTLYVADQLNHRIQVWTTTGQPRVTWGTYGAGPGAFDEPSAVAVDAQGNVYVADTGNYRIQKLSPLGQPLAQWGSCGSGLGEFDSPAGIAIDD